MCSFKPKRSPKLYYWILKFFFVSFYFYFFIFIFLLYNASNFLYYNINFWFYINGKYLPYPFTEQHWTNRICCLLLGTKNNFGILVHTMTTLNTYLCATLPHTYIRVYTIWIVARHWQKLPMILDSRGNDYCSCNSWLYGWYNISNFNRIKKQQLQLQQLATKNTNAYNNSVQKKLL